MSRVVFRVPKRAGETRNYVFDFTSDINSAGTTISSQVTTATVYSGVDPTPANLISGAASATGQKVSQKFIGGVAGVIYTVICTITTSDGQTLEQVGYFYVQPDLP